MTNTRAPIAFGTDGWRGRIARDLTFESLGRVVAAAGRWARDAGNTEAGDPDTIVFVHDTRFLSPELALHGAELLAGQGFEVLLSDRAVPTPCASWHVATRGLRMGLAVTASHNPAEWNGVKVKSRFGGSAMPATYDAIARSADDPLPARPGGAVRRTDLVT
ncbi:MAG: phosphoglucomutase/phosphomannomutase family protein, partial [Acidobacteria bacterium]|nr:phosphoglucomutase/phosphomannomutase family protein [Acidobacteriota bacterium]